MTDTATEAVSVYTREHTDGGRGEAMHREIRPRGCPLCWPPGTQPPPLEPPPPSPVAQHAPRRYSSRGSAGLEPLGEAIARIRSRQGKPPLDEATVPPRPDTAAEYIALVTDGADVSLWDQGPMCPTCSGTRRVRQPTLKPGDEGFGELAPCPDCQSYVTDTRVKRLWANAGLPADTEGLGLESYPQADKCQRQTVQDLNVYLERYLPEGKWLLMYGPVSVGKTVLGCAICRELIERLNRQATFQTVPKLIDRLRAAQRSDDGPAVDELLGVLETAPILMLDDLGAEALARNGQSTEFVREKLFRLIDERKNHRLVTIITSNHNLDELERRLGERIVDRLEQACFVVKVDGPNLRRPKRRGETA